MIKFKRCSKCKKMYPLTFNYFYHDKNALDGFHSACKDCDEKVRPKYNHEYYLKHRKAYQQQYYLKHREKIIQRNVNWRIKNPIEAKERSKRYYLKSCGRYNGSNRMKFLLSRIELAYQNPKSKSIFQFESKAIGWIKYNKKSDVVIGISPTRYPNVPILFSMAILNLAKTKAITTAA